MIFCADCAKNQIRNPKSEIRNEMAGWFPIPEDQLPLELPKIKSYEPTKTGESPLSTVKDWVNTKCPNCDGLAKRETDTMPNWAGSCWYFIAFSFWNEEKANSKFKIQNSKLIENWKLKIGNSGNWLPVDWYLGGAEHAVLHLLYSRFWVKALYDLKLLDFKEPFLKLRNQGMILAEDHRKMSKSFGNVINPDEVIKEYGADALRIYEMFMAPFNTEIPWSTKALQGSYRFVKRIWEIYKKYEIRNPKSEIKEDKKLTSKLYKTIQKVTTDIPEVKFNTSIAAMMEFLNDWERNQSGLSTENAKKFLQILAPFTPFLTEELWHVIFKEKQSIHLSSWPKVEGEIVEEEIIIPVQINGKLRDTIKVQSLKFKDQSYVEELALKSKKLKKYFTGKPKKIIYIQGKIINFIV
jgi:leucyl-tRNA synthetase